MRFKDFKIKFSKLKSKFFSSLSILIAKRVVSKTRPKSKPENIKADTIKLLDETLEMTKEYKNKYH
jgi:hypothetical protein